MNINEIIAGDNVPEEVNVFIEIPNDDGAVKYELDKNRGALVVERFFGTSLHYQANYGLEPHTLSEDNDLIDVLAIMPAPLYERDSDSMSSIGNVGYEG